MRKNLRKFLVSLIIGGVLFSGVIVQAKDTKNVNEVKPTNKIYKMVVDPPTLPPQ